MNRFVTALKSLKKGVCGFGSRLFRRGPRHAARWVWHHVYERYREWTLGIDTAGFDQWKGSLANMPCHDYEPMAYSCLERALEPLTIDPERDVLLDYGCGKGRALVVAAMLPFRRVIGIDLLDNLCQIAQDNIERSRDKLQCQDVEIVACDATQYDVPDDVTVIYLYNPFWGEVMEAVQDRIRASLVRSPRKLTIVYLLNTGQVDTFARHNWLKRVTDESEMWERVRWVVYESAIGSPAQQRAIVS